MRDYHLCPKCPWSGIPEKGVDTCPRCGANLMGENTQSSPIDLLFYLLTLNREYLTPVDKYPNKGKK